MLRIVRPAAAAGGIGDWAESGTASPKATSRGSSEDQRELTNMRCPQRCRVEIA
jgi:hypothetical protein